MLEHIMRPGIIFLQAQDRRFLIYARLDEDLKDVESYDIYYQYVPVPTFRSRQRPEEYILDTSFYRDVIRDTLWVPKDLETSDHVKNHFYDTERGLIIE